MVAVVALVLAASAAAANIATPRMVEVASWAAGKPITVYCSDSMDEWRVLSRKPTAGGFANVGGPQIWLSPRVCLPLRFGPGDTSFAPGLGVLLHEATHARGWRDEGLAECAALVLAYETLRRFYGVPFFSPLMRDLYASLLRDYYAAPPEYQGGCDRL